MRDSRARGHGNGDSHWFVMPGTRVRPCKSAVADLLILLPISGKPEIGGWPEHKPCAGHPRLPCLDSARKAWMGGTSPAMTMW
jgi:hypothetical protein